jgi:hypothetical protein
MKLTKRNLMKRYPEADEDFLVMMVENKLYMNKYHKSRLKELQYIIDEYFNKVYGVFRRYLISQKRDYFILNDIHAKKKLLVDCKTILNNMKDEVEKYYIETISQTYNYQRLYALWMLDVKVGDKNYSKPKPLGEMKEIGGEIKKSLVDDPGFSKSKLNEILSKSIIGKTFSERLDEGFEKGLDGISKSMDYATMSDKDGVGKEYNKFLINVRTKLTRSVQSACKRALAMGIEDAEDVGSGDVFARNNYASRKYQRVEILDGFTCIVCAGVDGDTYKEPLGLIHPNCRGIDVPCKLDENGNVVYRKGISGARRRSDSFDRWFNDLSEKDKRRVLGAGKYDKWKSGNLSINTIVNGARAKTLSEINNAEEITGLKSKFEHDYDVAVNAISKLKSYLPQKDISKMADTKEINAYEKFISQKEAIYRNMSSDELKNVGINRRTLDAEIRNERRILNLKRKELTLNNKMNKRR